MNKEAGFAAAAVVGALGLVWAVSASAERPRDHLKCYHVQDASEARATVDPDTLPFGVDLGCVIEAKAREVCVPANAEVLADAAAVPQTEGDDLAYERTCYRLKCPERPLPAVQVTDRFGTRSVTVRRAKTLCVPSTTP